MRLLLDTHTLLWAARGTLPRDASNLIEDMANELYFSPVNLWEIELKRSKLSVDPQELYRNLIINSYRELKITVHHVLQLSKLPTIHTDPFDRMLLAQASCERLQLLTADATIRQYVGQMDCILHYS